MTPPGSPAPSRLGFGAFKIGRNEGIKYPTGYALPTDAEVDRLLNGILDLGCTVIDTAPAYGLSEERIGRAIQARRGEYRLSTKVGETFADGRSTYDFSHGAVHASLERSLNRLQTTWLDAVYLHSSGDDLRLLTETDAPGVLQEWRSRGRIGQIGLSAKTVEGARLALEWSDLLMVEYNLRDPSFADVITEAHARGVDVYVKKGFASGHGPIEESIRFVLGHPGVTCLVAGGLSLEHFQANWAVAMDMSNHHE